MVNSDLAYNFIRQRILSGDYPPGHVLMTRELASDIGVSRTPVRDALRQLEADGLVDIRTHVGASVKTMGVKEFRDACGVRLALESHAAALAAENCTTKDEQDLRVPLNNMREITEAIIGAADEKKLLPSLKKEDVRFHLEIIKMARNDLLMKEILRLHLINRVVCGAMASRALVKDKAEMDRNRLSVLDSHTAIFDAIISHDPAAAKNAMERHIRDLVDKKLTSLETTHKHIVTRALTEAELVYDS